MKNLNIGKRLALGSGLLCLLAATLAWIGYQQIDSLRGQIDAVPELVDTRLALAEWQGQTSSNAARTVAILRSDDVALGQHLAGDMKATSARISELQKHIEAMPSTEAGKKLFADVGVARATYIAAREDVLKLKREKSPEAAAAFNSKFSPALASYQKAVQDFIDGNAADHRAEHALATRASARGVYGLAVFTAAFMLIAGLMVWLLARSITLPIRKAVQLAEALAKGDLTHDIESRSNDEIGALMRALAGANAQLAVLVRAIQESAATIDGGAQEISQGNNQLSSRTDSQASSLEETASSMEQITSTVRQNADNAGHANELVQGASAVAVKGGGVVGQVVATMNEISQSSKRIADIIGIIDGIAFQTNILALNAAVEAARAGDQGRGFAVVAGEVRSLAQRSAGAAKEIKALIDDSVGKVNSGSSLAAEAGRTMDEVVASVRNVAGITGDITAASREQASGIEQVNQAVTQMEQVTQQNAALVEQVAAAAASLREQARGLTQAVSVFRIRAA